jgi:chromate transporter
MDERPRLAEGVEEAGAGKWSGLASVCGLFLRLGATAFGGAAAYIAMMRDETVSRRRWLGDGEFLDLLGATNLAPGPNAMQMAMHIGRRRAGWPGLVVAGVCFAGPATLITMVFAWAYVRYGSSPQLSWVLYGIKPIVICVMVQAIWNLGRSTVRNALLPVLGIGVLVLYMVGLNAIVLLVGAGIVAMVISSVGRVVSGRVASGLLLVKSAGGLKAAVLGAGAVTAASASFSLGKMFLTFVKIGAVLYGGAYVVVPLLRADFVDRLGWVSEKQLLDAVAVGQVTPGPFLSSATFIGYLLSSWEGALLATVAVFLPSFVLVAIMSPVIPHVRGSPWTAALLDGVSVGALGLMAGVTWQLGRAAIVDPLTAAVAVVGAVLLLRLRLSSGWLVLLGGLIGLVSKAAGG